MCVIIDLHTQRAELREQPFNLLLPWVSAHIPDLLVLISSQDFVHDSGKLIGDGHFGFVFGSKPETQFSVLGAVKRSFAVSGPLCRLNQDFP